MTMKDNLREALKTMQVGDCIHLDNNSQIATARALAAQLGFRLTIKKVLRGGFTCYKKSPKTEKVFPLESVNQQGFLNPPPDTPTPIRYAPKHWELRNTPFGKSGTPLRSLSWREEPLSGFDGLRVYNADLGITFDPAHVTNPSALSNRLARTLNQPDNNIMLNADCLALPVDEAETWNRKLEEWTPSCQ